MLDSEFIFSIRVRVVEDGEHSPVLKRESHQYGIDNKQSYVDGVEPNSVLILVWVDESGCSNRSTLPWPSTMKLIER